MIISEQKNSDVGKTCQSQLRNTIEAAEIKYKILLIIYLRAKSYLHRLNLKQI